MRRGSVALKPGGFPRAGDLEDMSLKAQMDMIDLGLEEDLRKLQRRRVPLLQRRDVVKRLLFEIRKRWKRASPDVKSLLASDACIVQKAAGGVILGARRGKRL